MSGKITNAIIGFIELLEAEGREFRTQAETTLRSVVYLFIGLLFVLFALLALSITIYVILTRFIGTAGASFTVAVFLGLCALFFFKKSTALSRENKAKDCYNKTLSQDENNVDAE